MKIIRMEERVEAWAKYVRSSRNMLTSDPDVVREAKTEGEVDAILRIAVQRAGIPLIENSTTILNYILKWRIPSLVGYALSPWIPQADKIGTAAEKITGQAKKVRGLRSASPSKSKYEAIAKAKSIPGRIERRFRQADNEV